MRDYGGEHREAAPKRGQLSKGANSKRSSIRSVSALKLRSEPQPKREKRKQKKNAQEKEPESRHLLDKWQHYIPLE